MMNVTTAAPLMAVAKTVLRAIHGVDIFDMNHLEHRQHQDADAAAKKASVKSNEELHQGEADQNGQRRRPLALDHVAKRPGQPLAKGEEQGGDSEQVRNQAA